MRGFPERAYSMNISPKSRFKGVFPFILAGIALVQSGWAKSFQSIKGESTLSYYIVHPMQKFSGVIRDFTCKVNLAPEAALSKMKVSAAIHFDGSNPKGNSRALEMLEPGKFPKVEFESKSVKRDGDGYKVAGNLTFHGQTKPIQFRISPHFLPHKVQVVGGFDVKLSDFEVKRPRLLFMPVDDKLTINFNLYSMND